MKCQNEAIRDGKKRPHDSFSATKIPPSFIGEDNLKSALFEDKEMKSKIDFIHTQTDLYFHDDYETGEPNHQKDLRLKNKVKNQHCTLSLLKLIYATRCNMFHGEKNLSGVQKNLLKAMVKILEKTSAMLYDKLEKHAQSPHVGK